MPFTLEVEFSGLCMYLTHPTNNSVAVVMPDGRLKKDPVFADDGKATVPHVGYLRFDLADTGATVEFDPTKKDPIYEVIHRFSFETLNFGLKPDTNSIARDIGVPIVCEFAPQVKPKDGLFGNTPPKELLMRTVMEGGMFVSERSDSIWRFSTLFDELDAKPYTESFAGFVTWTREISESELVLELESWVDKAKKTTIKLKPADGKKIRLKIANLCADNPIEWEDLIIRDFVGELDNDFKWFYKILQSSVGSFESLTKDRGLLLPVPELIVAQGGGESDCTGIQTECDFTNPNC